MEKYDPERMERKIRNIISENPGIPKSQIAEKLGVSTMLVFTTLRRLGIKYETDRKTYRK